ncbi:post-transcriptional regulator [Indiicoccus explosivorum]|uniref:post-transcriptional regulator n=1 Tax=Indiicoccus explosivorum TaxID=1917864 RepID=UPI00138FBE2F|nr:post-transcriptional regulator [Indiicoccus explosivorum]
MEWPDQYEQLLPVLKTKCAEMRTFDQAKLLPEDLWVYCIQKVWRNEEVPAIPLHGKVQDILAVRLSDYVEYRQAEGFRTEDWFSGADSGDWAELLKPKAPGEKRFDRQ